MSKKHQLSDTDAKWIIGKISNDLWEAYQKFPPTLHKTSPAQARRIVTGKIKKNARLLQQLHMRIIAHGWKPKS